jgi:putative membrane protein
MAESDPRVYFASERTLLAWVRTGLAVIGLGFVVARFGLFLQELHPNQREMSHLGSTLIGVGLVALGSGSVAMAAWQHARFCRQLGRDEFPRSYATSWSIYFAGILASVGMALAAYLLFRAAAFA